MKTLDSWQIANPSSRRFSVAAGVKWGLAAVFCLSLGLAAGRLSAPGHDTDHLRAEIASRVREELRHELGGDLRRALATAETTTDRKLLELAAAWTQAREQDREMVLILYNRSLEQRRADLNWLRRDLETVAINADQYLNATRRKLGRLAAVSQPLLEPADFITPNPEKTDRKIPQ